MNKNPETLSGKPLKEVLLLIAFFQMFMCFAFMGKVELGREACSSDQSRVRF